MSKRYVGHTVAWELPNRDSVTKGNYNLEDIETKYLPMQTEVVSDNKDHTIDELKQRIAELEEQLKKSQNQKAIEELEKLKSAILSERNTTYFKFDNFNKGKDTAYYWANEIIDNQIKKLKGEE